MLRLFNRDQATKMIKVLANEVAKLVQSNPELLAKTDQVGIIDGDQIINDFLEHNENGLALEHLIYMIQASGVSLDAEQLANIQQLAKSMGMPAPDLDQSSDMESPPSSSTKNTL